MSDSGRRRPDEAEVVGAEVLRATVAHDLAGSLEPTRAIGTAITAEDRYRATPSGLSSPSPSSSSVSISQSPSGVGRGTRIRHYEVIRELGRGGMAQVFLARDTRLGRRVAIKIIASASSALAQRFISEAVTTAQCVHENIVVIHEVDVHQGFPYMVLEYLEGSTLSSLMRKQIIPPAQAIELMVPVCRALAVAHAAGIVHRDLKPSNILLTRTGQIKVLDFGIAKVLGEAQQQRRSAGGWDSKSDPNLTQDGLVGTPPYMSPEQIRQEDIDHRTDLWAAGVILFRMLTGKHPAGSTRDTLHILSFFGDAERPLPLIRTISDKVPPGLAAVVDRCLLKPADGRWQSAEELADALEQQSPNRYRRRLSGDENPFPGLGAFQESDADRFFGRERDIDAMVARLRDVAALAVVGPSGVGKSSLVRAGLVPALKSSGDPWEVLTIRPGRSPLRVLAQLLVDLGAKEEISAIVTLLQSQPGFLANLLRKQARRLSQRVLVFVDQFEELYTLCQSEDERRSFLACLLAISDDTRSRLRLVLSMRSDLLDRLAEDRDFADHVMRGLVLLTTPDSASLRSALVSPVELAGFRYESEEVVTEMVEGLRGSAGALPLMQFVASRLWEERDRSAKLITSTAYASIGGVAGALAGHADDVLAALPESSQRFVRAAFCRLVTPDRTRAVVDLDELVELADDPDSGRRVVDYLVQSRLLVIQTGGDAGRATVELVHESLIVTWPKLNRWLEESQGDAVFRAELASAAKQWDSRDRPEGYLWTGDAATEVRRWIRDNDTGGLTSGERDFLHEVSRLATRSERRRRNVVLAVIALLSAISLAGAAGVVWIGKAEREASDQALAAEREADRARKAEAVAQDATRKAEASAAALAEQLRRVKQAEAAREKAIAEADKANADVELSQAELARANRELRSALGRAKTLQEAAQQAAEREKDARARAEVLLRKETARRKELEARKGEISNTLH